MTPDAVAVPVPKVVGRRNDSRCEARKDGHRCSFRQGHEGPHRAFGATW